jgi:hypothetical protein
VKRAIRAAAPRVADFEHERGNDPIPWKTIVTQIRKVESRSCQRQRMDLSGVQLLALAAAILFRLEALRICATIPTP